MQVKSKWRGKPRDWKGLRRHKPRVKGETACAGCLQQHWRRFLSEMTKDMQTGTSRSMTFRNLGYFSGEIMWFFFSPKGFPIFLEKEMAIHSSTLAWKIPWTEEPDRLQSMWLHFTSLHSLNWTNLVTWHMIDSQWNTVDWINTKDEKEDTRVISRFLN